MTVKQFRAKVRIVRIYGQADLGNGLTICFTGFHWAIRRGKETITTADSPDKLEYLFD